MTGRPRARAFGITNRVNVAIAAAVFIVLYALLIAVSPIAGSSFLINNFVVLATPLALAAVGTSLVLIIGGFDLSVAGTISLSNVIAATAMAAHPGAEWPILFLVLALGAAVGLVNGIFIAVLGLPSLGVTLSTNIVLAGFALVILPAPGGSVPDDFVELLTGTVGPLPVAGLVLVVVAALWILFAKTRTGMSVFAIGGDPSASRLSGIPIRRVQVVTYALAGLCYSAAGLYFSALTATGSPTAGSSFLLSAFAAAALGLVSFRGGSGSAIAAIFGAATLTVIPKFLFAGGLADFWVGAFQGLVILLALCIPWVSRRLNGLRRVKTTHPAGPTPIGPAPAAVDDLGGTGSTPRTRTERHV